MVSFGSSTIAPAAHPTEFRLPGRSERMLASNGHINASDKKDALKTIGDIFQCMSSGQLGSLVSEEEAASRAKIKADRKELIKAALADTSGRTFKAVGTAIGAEIYQTANREGFMRRFLQKANLEMGTIPVSVLLIRLSMRLLLLLLLLFSLLKLVLNSCSRLNFIFRTRS